MPPLTPTEARREVGDMPWIAGDYSEVVGKAYGTGPFISRPAVLAILARLTPAMPASEALREALTQWAQTFLDGLSFNEPALQKKGWAKRRAPDVAESITAAIEAATPSLAPAVEVMDAVIVLLAAKSGPYTYASQPQRDELHRAKAVWERYVALRAGAPEPSPVPAEGARE
jgi:hypothetical protein